MDTNRSSNQYGSQEGPRSQSAKRGDEKRSGKARRVGEPEAGLGFGEGGAVVEVGLLLVSQQ